MRLAVIAAVFGLGLGAAYAADVVAPLTDAETPVCASAIREKFAAHKVVSQVEFISCANELSTALFIKNNYPWMDLLYRYQNAVLKDAIAYDRHKIPMQIFKAELNSAALDFKAAVSERYQALQAAQAAQQAAQQAAIADAADAQARAAAEAEAERQAQRQADIISTLNALSALSAASRPYTLSPPTTNTHCYQQGPYLNCTSQ